MTVSRSRALALTAGGLALAACGGAQAVVVGSKNFTESFVIAEIYAQTLEAAGLRVERRFNLGSSEIALEAIRRGDIDLYPEYTGTALLDILHLAPEHDPESAYLLVKRDFSQQFDLVWLARSPMNDSQAIATTAAVAKRERLATLSDLAKAAPRLRLATIQEFLTRADGLPGLQKVYGGFEFREVRTYDIAVKYQALLQNKADVASAFSTDGAIEADNLILLRDDKGLWPAYNVAPVVRRSTLKAKPQIKTALDAVSPSITDAAARHMNAQVEGAKQDPAEVAAAFLAGRGGRH
jgi:osmoprotectant transport system substrate-binding protein